MILRELHTYLEKYNLRNQPLAPLSVRLLLSLGYGYTTYFSYSNLLLEKTNNFSLVTMLGPTYLLDILSVLIGWKTMIGWNQNDVLKHHIPSLISFFCVDNIAPNSKVGLLMLTSSIHEFFFVISTFGKNIYINFIRYWFGLFWYFTFDIMISFETGYLIGKKLIHQKIIILILELLLIKMHTNFTYLRWKKTLNVPFSKNGYSALHIFAFAYGIYKNFISNMFSKN
tara:strand:+ start:231 stop:911 length:681 start_codon:yes stop_codon:yes gene_type:complete